MSLAIVEPYTLSSSEARAITDQIKEHTDAVWKLLVVAHEGSAWKPLGYTTWAEYVAGEFNMSRAYSYRVLDQARVIRAIEEAVSPYGDIPVSVEEKTARDIKPVLAAVIEDAKANLADLEPEPSVDDVKAAIDSAVQAHRPVTKHTETAKDESFFDSETGEQVEPPEGQFKLPPVPKVEKSVKQQNAEQAAFEFGKAVYTLIRTTSPEGRGVILRAWADGSDACTPTTQEHVTAAWFRMIARGLNALANEWESK